MAVQKRFFQIAAKELLAHVWRQENIILINVRPAKKDNLVAYLNEIQHELWRPPPLKLSAAEVKVCCACVP